MRASRRSHVAKSRTQHRRGTIWGLRTRPAWASICARRKLCCLAVVALGLGATAPTAAASSNQPKTVFQCQKKFRTNPKARASCIKQVSSKPGSSCARPLIEGTNYDHEQRGEVGVKLTDENSVVFPPNGEGFAPPGWANFTMGPVTGVRRTEVSYGVVGWELNTHLVALCRAVLFELRPGTASDGGLNIHEKPLSNRTEASYNIAFNGEYGYRLALFERYVP